MRKILSVLTVLVMVSMLLACRPLSIRSGDEGGGGGGGDHKTVALSFDLTLSEEVAKSISAHPDPNYYDDVEFWYRAIPQNIPGDAAGDTSKAAGKDENSFVKLVFADGTPASMDNTSGTVGYFTEGEWAFDIEVRKPLEDSSYAVLWKTSSSVIKSIDSNNNNISFILSKNIDPSLTGTVTFEITTVRVSDTDSFEVYYSDIDSQKPENKIEGLILDQDDLQSTLTGSTELPSGLYNLWVYYYADGDVLVGTGMTTLEVRPSEEITVDGTIEAGHVTVSLTIKGMYKLSVSVDAEGDPIIDITDNIYSVSVTDTGTVNFTCTPEITELDGSAVDPEPEYSYEWRINGETVSSGGSDAATYEWNLANYVKQNVYVDCIVSIKDGETVTAAACITLGFKVIE